MSMLMKIVLKLKVELIMVRIFFSNSMLLDRLSAYIFDSYNEGIERWNSILEYGLDDDFEEYLVNSTSIDEVKMK